MRCGLIDTLSHATWMKTDEQQAGGESPVPALHPKMKILVVDDEPFNVALLEDMLSLSGYKRVKSISDSRLAFETYRGFEPDLVLLDLMMPHIDGFQVLETLRSTASEILLPVIVLTADATEETRRRAFRAGASDFLLKPLDHAEVLSRIGNMLEIRRVHLQLDLQRGAVEDAARARTSELRDAPAALETPVVTG